MKLSTAVAFAVAIASAAPALAVGAWGQCGGINYSGSTTCDAGTTCTYLNDWYYQCIPGSSTSSSTSTTSSTKTTTSTTKTTTTTTTTSQQGSGTVCPNRTKFTYFGVNESGAEFGNTKVPGVLGTDYTWPSPSSVDYFVAKGFNTFRVAFLMERLSPPSSGLTGSFDSTYLNGLKTIVSYITGEGAYAVVDPHNFMIYNGQQISSTSNFQTWWKNLASQFKSDSHVIFDVMNEPHDIAASTVASLNQAAINGIRSAGATSQLILVEGTSYTGAWTWTSSGNAAAFTSLTDPNNNFAIEMHQYLDSDGSGTSATCVSSTIGAERVADATNWLKSHGLRGFLGEIGAGSNSACISAVQGALCSMQQSGVWIGALWWAAGPWWGTYFQSIEPPSGAAIPSILPQALVPFL